MIKTIRKYTLTMFLVIAMVACDLSPLTKIGVFAQETQNSITDPTIDGAEVYASIKKNRILNKKADNNSIEDSTTGEGVSIESILSEPGDGENDNELIIQEINNSGEKNNDDVLSESELQKNMSAFLASVKMVSYEIQDNDIQLQKEVDDENNNNDTNEKVLVENYSEESQNVDTAESKSISSLSNDNEELSGECGDSIKWLLDVDTNVLEITGIGAIDDYSESPWSTYNNKINLIKISEGITSIGSYAFSDLSNVTEIELPNSIEKIGYKAFAYCESLSQINIPLNWVECPTASTSGTIDSDNCGHIFEGCKELTNIEVPEGIEELPAYAFNACNYIENVILPESLTNVTHHAFFNCTALTKIELPVGISFIGKSAFCYCDSLREVTM